MAQYKSNGKIDNVKSDSPAGRAGLQVGRPFVEDQRQASQGRGRLSVPPGRQPPDAGSRTRRASAPLVFNIRKPEQQDLGLQFVDPTFDGIKRCNNHCPFCFVDQNAPGLRQSLDIKDDDFRYSFLYGGFITLTNLKESDWERVNEERLSPLYVSVHATEF